MTYPKPDLSFTGWLLGIRPNSNNIHENPQIWLNKIYDFIENKKDFYEEHAIDLLFEKIDDLLIDHKLAEVNSILNIIDLNKLNKNLFIGLLVITNIAKSYLPNRKSLIEKIKVILKKDENEESINKLLGGLV